MLEVDIDKILPVTEARDNFNKIIDEVEGSEHMYVLTKNGKPSAVIVGVNHLEKLTGKTADELTSIVEKKADETPVVEEVTEANSPGEGVAAGPKPAETDVPAAGQSIQPSSATANSSPIDVSADEDESAPTENVAVTPSEQPVAAPTSSPGGVGPVPESSQGPMPAESAGAPVSNVAPNQTPLATPPENGQTNDDSDLFV